MLVESSRNEELSEIKGRKDICKRTYNETSFLATKMKYADTLEELIAGLREAFAQDKVNIDEVNHLLTSYKSNPAEWKKYAKFDKYKYTRNLIDEGNGRYNLMLLCWGEGHGSAIHDHANAHCFMKILQGNLSEVRFDWPEERKDSDINDGEVKPLKMLSRTLLPTNGVCYINDSLGLHRVENPSSTDPAVSLHVYCPPFDECNVFNQQTGYKTVSKVTFWSKYGNKPNRKIQDERPPEDN